jgi:hypothetical protein
VPPTSKRFDANVLEKKNIHNSFEDQLPPWQVLLLSTLFFFAYPLHLLSPPTLSSSPLLLSSPPTLAASPLVSAAPPVYNALHPTPYAPYTPHIQRVVET